MIYYIAPDNNAPIGGIRKIYDHVDILNSKKIQASVLHNTPTFRVDWFKNNTHVSYMEQIRNGINIADYLVFPEIYSPEQIKEDYNGAKKLIFNQGCYLTFIHFPLIEKGYNINNLQDIKGIICVSEHSKNYLNYCFPEMPVYRTINSINYKLFKPERKQKIISFSANKNYDTCNQILNILKLKNASDYQLINIQNMKEEDVAHILGISEIFLSTNQHEGFSLMPLEAMSCGCIVIGYHAMGGQEYFKEEHSFLIPENHVLEFSKKILEVIKNLKLSSDFYSNKTKKARQYVIENYGYSKEVDSVIINWKAILEDK